VRTLSEFESGFAIGRWARPLEGFEWKQGLRPIGAGVGEDDAAGGQDPWLVARRGRAESYPLLRRAGLLESFARLAEDPNASAIMRFASRWGFLRNPIALVGKEVTGSVTDWDVGEPMSIWVAAASEFRLLYTLAQDVAIAERGGSWPAGAVTAAGERLRKAVRSTPSAIRFEFDQSAEGGLRGWRYLAGSAERDAELRERLDGARPSTVARFYVAREVNRHLADVQAALLPFADSRIRMVPTTLEAAVYLRLAQFMGGMGQPGLPERPCDHCGTPFAPTRPNQRYCTREHLSAASYRRRRARTTGLAAAGTDAPS
jgi:hypothetical protein